MIEQVDDRQDLAGLLRCHEPRPDDDRDRDAGNGRRVLLLSEFFPRKPETQVYGVFRRLRSHVDALKAFGALDLAFFWPAGEFIAGNSTEGVEAFRAAWGFKGRIWFIATGKSPGGSLHDRFSDMLWAWRGAVGFFHDKTTQRTSRSPQVRSLTHILATADYDLVFAHRIGSAAPLVRLGGDAPPFVVDFDDLEHVRFSRNPLAERTLRTWVGGRRATALAVRAERLVAERAACSLVCSAVDQQRLQALSPNARIAVVANCADPDVALSDCDEPVAVFVGTARYAPNREGIQWLASRVWPLVCAAIPAARLVVVGDGSQELGIDNPGLGISVLGFQKNLDDLYRKAAIALCPIHSGSGTRIKVIEAAMHALPVVSTTVGAEGLTFEDGSEILIADDPAAFAQACTRLFGNVQTRREIGHAARERARRENAPQVVRDRVLSICAGACRAP